MADLRDEGAERRPVQAADYRRSRRQTGGQLDETRPHGRKQWAEFVCILLKRLAGQPHTSINVVTARLLNAA
jgi:hypothetical protein